MLPADINEQVLDNELFTFTTEGETAVVFHCDLNCNIKLSERAKYLKDKNNIVLQIKVEKQIGVIIDYSSLKLKTEHRAFRLLYLTQVVSYRRILTRKVPVKQVNAWRY